MVRACLIFWIKRPSRRDRDSSSRVLSYHPLSTSPLSIQKKEGRHVVTLVTDDAKCLIYRRLWRDDARDDAVTTLWRRHGGRDPRDDASPPQPTAIRRSSPAKAFDKPLQQRCLQAERDERDDVTTRPAIPRPEAASRLRGRVNRAR